MRKTKRATDRTRLASTFLPRTAVLLFSWLQITAASAFGLPPNLVSNSDFDVDLSDWTSEGGNVSWSPVDADEDPDSGSALIDASSIAEYLSQCVAIEPSSDYRETVRVRYASDPVKDDVTQMRIFLWDGDCFASSTVGLEWRTLIPQDTEWRELTLNITAPADAVSALIDVVTLSTNGDPMVHVDDFRLMPHAIFSDSFESGDTSAWPSGSR